MGGIMMAMMNNVASSVVYTPLAGSLQFNGSSQCIDLICMTLAKTNA
jgi:hypothetical protein